MGVEVIKFGAQHKQTHFVFFFFPFEYYPAGQYKKVSVTRFQLM
jgi:hypothetical protein